ncbi:MAG: cytidine deaminase [Chloroflexota bacterium]
MSDSRGRVSDLLEVAREAAVSAYAPYSRFRVGAAALADGYVVRGVNIESASYGLTVCAERVAIFGAIASGYQCITALAVSCIDAAPDLGESGRMPCGACRQVIAEHLAPDAHVEVDGVGLLTVEELLPRPFRL